MTSSGSTNHVGPILFANRTARSQLLHEGEVVSFRAQDRTTGETWWRKSRTGEKMGDVVVEKITGEIKPAEEVLEEYYEDSGFQSTDNWVQAIEEENGGAPLKGYLYRVTATKGTCGKCGETARLPTNRFCPPCEREEASDIYASRTAPR